MEELISVIIPTYNRRSTIGRCLESVQNQTYGNIEIIIIDDGSGDGTEELFKDNKDERIRYHRYTPNRGACYARNYGARLAKGDYIAFQDSDDEWIPEKLERQLHFIKSTGADFIFCGMNRIDPDNNLKYYYPTTTFDHMRDAVEQLLIENTISTQTIMIKRDVFKDIQFDESFKRYQDWDFSLQAALSGKKIVYQKEALVDSVVQKDSISSKVSPTKAYEHFFEKYNEIFEKYPKAMSSIYRKMGISYRYSNRKKTKRYLKESLKYDFDIKTMIKLLLYYVRLW